MSAGLNINDVVNVQIILAPSAAQGRNFGNLLIVGSSPVIDTTTRIREYTSLAAVGVDFGEFAQEYAAAVRFFGQSPQPQQVFIGRWAQAATPAQLYGAGLTSAQQVMSLWTAVITPGFAITLDGTVHQIDPASFAGLTNLNAVAAAIQTALNAAEAGVTCVWNSTYHQFIITDGTTGPTSTVSFLSAPSGGKTDISSMMGMNVASVGAYAVQGIAAESLLACATTLANMSSNWYGLYCADVVDAQTSDYVAVAGLIEGASPSRMFGITSQDPNTLITNNETSVAYLVNAAGYNRTFVQYSSLDPQAAVSEFGRFLTVDPSGDNTTLTMKFKQEPGVLAETLNEVQAQALIAINCNVFVNYNNSTAIVQNGTVASGRYIDEIWGLDWLQNYVQTNVYNVLYGSPTKIPQTDAGVNILVGVVNQSLQQAVTNGFVAPGIWTGPPVGALNTGDTLTTGYYAFANPVASQTTSQRAARQSPPIQACIKLAGAIHSANVIMNVNR